MATCLEKGGKYYLSWNRETGAFDGVELFPPGVDPRNQEALRGYLMDGIPAKDWGDYFDCDFKPLEIPEYEPRLQEKKIPEKK